LDEARIEMRPGDVIFNTPEQLAALGLKQPLSKEISTQQGTYLFNTASGV
jgi:hypothetical protein